MKGYRNEENKALPPYWTKKGGSYYYLAKGKDPDIWEGKKWYRLGRTFDEAWAVYTKKITGSEKPIRLEDFNPDMHDFKSKKKIIADSFMSHIEPVVYFLIKDCDIVYVGQSTNVFARLSTHYKNADMDFDRVSSVAVKEEDLFVVETHYIRLLKPKYNELLKF